MRELLPIPILIHQKWSDESIYKLLLVFAVLIENYMKKQRVGRYEATILKHGKTFKRVLEAAKNCYLHHHYHQNIDLHHLNQVH